ncbi:MAG: xylulose kinase [archaeon]|nr:xylulose kinase [archaeon]
MKLVENTKYILAIDHGTSGLKSALVSVYGKVIGFEFEKTPLYLFPGGGAEQDTKEWWEAFIISSKRLIAKNLVPVDDIVAICVSSQWSCTVAIGEDGEPLMNAISWMDSRGGPYVQKMVKGIINIAGYGIKKLLKFIPKAGGGPLLSGKGPIGHIEYIKNELPDIFNKTYKFLDAKDYMNFKLTGNLAASFDSIYLHWAINCRDINNLYYDEKLMKELDLDRKHLPELMKSTDVVGLIKSEVAKEIGINKDVKVICGSPDLQSAAIGSGAVRNFEPHIYLGTSSWILAHVPFKKTDVFHYIGSIPSGIPGRYLVTDEQETAGACLTYLRDQLVFYHSKEDKPHEYEELDEICEKVPAGSENLIFTPWLYGERQPVEDDTVRGGFFNMSLKHNLDHCVRAVFEGIAFNSRWLYVYVEKIAGRKMDPLNIIGGGANSDVWCQIYADVMNRTMRRVKDPIYSNARGAAFIASVGLGYIKWDDIPGYIEIDKVFEPNPDNREVYDKLFKEFVQIYKKNNKIYRRLNSH